MIKASDIVERVRPQEAWPLKRKLAWVALYIAIFAWAAFIILPQGSWVPG